MKTEIQIPIKCTCGSITIYRIHKILDLTLKCELVRLLEEDDNIVCTACGSRLGVFIDIEGVEHKKGTKDGTRS